MKKILVLLVSVFTLFFAVGCGSSFNLDGYVSELRCDVFEGTSENYNLKAIYGFEENSLNHDGIRGEIIYGITFKLLDKETSNAEYSVSIVFNGETKKAVFSLNPVTENLTAFIEINGFNLKEFSVEISLGAEKEKVTLTSIVPLDTISYHTALERLYEQQTDLIDSYRDENGYFIGEIIARIIVKEQNTYWYIGLINGKQLRAMLIDGKSGEVLAIREIM